MTDQLPESLSSNNSIIFISGGMGNRNFVSKTQVIHQLKDIIEGASYCLTVCTGSALLAKTGLINGKRATSNQMAWSWVTSLNKNVLWEHGAGGVKIKNFIHHLVFQPVLICH